VLEKVGALLVDEAVGSFDLYDLWVVHRR